METSSLLALRPDLSLETENLMPLQAFQNATLRPVLKLLHTKIIKYANEQMPKLKNIQQPNERRLFIKQFFDKNPQQSAYLQGLVSGFFTEEEYAFYLGNLNEANKRIKDLFIERIATS